MDGLTSGSPRKYNLFECRPSACGYLQLELAEDRRYLKLFRHSRVRTALPRLPPFGLDSFPSAFQQVVRKILDGLDGCVRIFDDIIIYGLAVAENDERYVTC